MARSANDRYEIRVNGQLPETWSDWFEQLEVINQPNDGAILRGSMADQASMIGLLNRIHSLNLQIMAVRRMRNSPRQEQTAMDQAEITRYIRESRIACLASVDEEGAPRVRPMGMGTVYDGRIYFFSFATTSKVSEFATDSRVEIVWSRPDEHSQVRVCGSVALEEDTCVVRRFRKDNPVVDRMVPSEAAPRFRLYRVEPQKVRVALGFVPYTEVPWSTGTDAPEEAGQ